MESRYRELEDEKSKINNQFETDKLDYQRRLKELEDERQDLLNKNRVNSFSHSRFEFFHEFLLLGTRRKFN